MILDEKGYQAATHNPAPIEYDIDSNGCWIPKNLFRDKDGYVIVTRFCRKVKLHRYVYTLVTGESISSKIIIRHTCDNPECCNPEHLLTGSIQDNNQDMVDRGRYRTGLNHHHSHNVTEDIYIQIKSFLNEGLKPKEIANFINGISIDIIRSIKIGRHWSCKKYCSCKID